MPDDSGLDLNTTATPNELAFKRAYAKALIEQSLGPITTPAVSPFQAIGGLLQGYAGRNMLNNAAQQERSAFARYGQGMAGEGPPWAGPLSTQPPADAQATGYTDDTTPLMNAVSREEGTGSYSQLGPVTKTGDRAYGKYQVMGANIGPWSREILGQELTPDQFLHNPGAQEAIARAKLSQYSKQYGPVGAAKAWFAGPGGMNNPNARDQLGTTVGQYGANVAAMLPGGGTPQGGAQNASAVGPLAFRPPGGVPGANMGVGAAGTPSPGLFPIRPRMTQQEYQYIAGNPRASEADKAAARQTFLEQNQPVSLGAYGGNYVLNPANGQSMFVPGAPQMGTRSITAPGGGGVSTPYPMFTMPPPGPGQPPAMFSPKITPGPQSSAAPTGPEATPAIQAQPTEAGTLPPGKSSEAETPTRIAMLENPNIASDAAPIGVSAKGPLAAKPPEPASFKTAQAGSGLPPGITPEDAAEFGWLRNQGLQYEFGKKDMDMYNKEYADFTGKGTAANAYIPQIQYAQQLMEQPGFLGIQGPGADFKVLWNKGLSLLGNKEAEQNLSYDQVFTKMISGGILRDMKTMLGGWAGQVRNAEINLMNKASATRYNTPEANRAVLDMGLRSAQQLVDIGNTVRDYRLESQRSGQVPTAAGQQERINAYLEQHPLYTPEEIKVLNHTFDMDSKESSKKSGPLSVRPPGAGPGLPPGAVGPLKKVQ